MRRTLTCIAGAAALALTLAACGDSGSTPSATTKACTTTSSLKVGGLDQLKFDAAAYDASPGCIEVTYTNEGTVAHTLLVKDQSGFKLAIGKVDTGKITLDAGTYTLYCDVAGHEKAGMKATLTVG